MTPVRRPVAVVTGAARGGGRGIALALGGYAGTVVLVGRSTREHPNRLLPGTLEETREQLASSGSDVACFPADLGKSADRTALCEFVLTTCGGCDILVNNAAYNPIMPFAGMPARRWETVLEVNLNAAVALTRALRTEALAALIGDPEPGSRGVTPAELGAAVRWIVQQPASFTGHVLTFQRLRELGALPLLDPEVSDER